MLETLHRSSANILQDSLEILWSHSGSVENSAQNLSGFFRYAKDSFGTRKDSRWILGGEEGGGGRRKKARSRRENSVKVGRGLSRNAQDSPRILKNWRNLEWLLQDSCRPFLGRWKCGHSHLSLSHQPSNVTRQIVTARLILPMSPAVDWPFFILKKNTTMTFVLFLLFVCFSFSLLLLLFF